jgi:formylglycine-generating enzyme required for sulfatase activity
MMYVEGGTFMMGSDAPDAEKDEKPVHEVTLSDYYIGQTEVTQKLWKLVMGNNNNPSANQGDELPVTNISRADCQTFVEKLSELTGLRFRLPTEAEWEYAARGGQNSKGYVYAGSNDINEVAWYPSNCQKPQAVGQKKPNELGIYDMSGNVYEFCYDWYGAYPAEPQTNPQGPSAASNGYRSCRGGCWQKQNKGDDASYCRIANRGHDIKGNERIGLRIVMEK